MAKTKLFVFILFLLFASVLANAYVAAQDYGDDEEAYVSPEEQQLQIERESVNKAFSWLSNQVKDKWPTSVEDTALTLLALSYDDYLAYKGRKALLEKSKYNNTCWVGESGNCEIKATALAILALNKLGRKTQLPENWILSRKTKFNAINLNWNLQIDSPKETNCTVSYEGGDYKIHLDEKPVQKVKILTEPTGLRCLQPSSGIMSGYWLQIVPACLNKTFSIKCDEEAKVSLPYEKGVGTKAVLFVPSETFNAPVEVEIKAECLMDEGNTKCDYEGTAWAAYALSVKRRPMGSLLPYLVSQAEDAENEKYLPDAFLYLITEKTEYADNLLGSKYYYRQGYWKSSSVYGMYYSTALAVMALKNYFAADTVITKTKEYLLDPQRQNSYGYWDDGNKVRDTAFILYVLWYGKGEPPVIPSNETMMYETINRCEDEEYPCKETCSDSEEELSYYTADCQKGYGSTYKCCQPKETSSDCTLVQDCLKWGCEGKWVGNCKCENLKETSCDDMCDNDGDGFIDNDDGDCQLNDCEKNNYVCCHECESEVEHLSQYDGSCAEGTVCCELCKIVDVEICNNKIDDDGDSLIDCKDSDCKNTDACKKAGLWLWILIAVVIIGGGVGAYFYCKQKGIEAPDFIRNIFGKKEEFQKYKFTPVAGRQPITRQAQQQQQPQQAAGSQRPVVIRPRPYALRQLERKPTKSKTEEELEKTLKQLESMDDSEES